MSFSILFFLFLKSDSFKKKFKKISFSVRGGSEEIRPAGGAEPQRPGPQETSGEPQTEIDKKF